MQYFIIDDDLIDDLNRGIMRSLRPESKRDPSYVTDLYAVKVTHPVNGDTAIAIGGEEVSFDVEAQVASLTSVYNQMQSRGTITIQESNDMRQWLLDSRGTSVVMSDFIPPSIPANTYEDLDAAGWFPAQGE